MNVASAVVRLIDAMNEHVGRVISWLTLFMVLTQVFVVIMRYVYGVGWIWVQETIVYMHAAVFLAAAGYTLVHDGHVRVDVFYRPATRRQQAAVDLLGSAFLLLPMVIAIFWLSWPYVSSSWSVLEASPEGAGLPTVFLLKSLILVYTLLVGLQGVALALRSLLTLAGVSPPARPADGKNAESV